MDATETSWLEAGVVKMQHTGHYCQYCIKLLHIDIDNETCEDNQSIRNGHRLLTQLNAALLR